MADKKKSSITKQQAERMLSEYNNNLNNVPFSRRDEFIKLHRDQVVTLTKIANGERVSLAFD